VTPESLEEVVRMARSNPPQDKPIWVELKA
jgi:hypothetical protein